MALVLASLRRRLRRIAVPGAPKARDPATRILEPALRKMSFLAFKRLGVFLLFWWFFISVCLRFWLFNRFYGFRDFIVIVCCFSGDFDFLGFTFWGLLGICFYIFGGAS